jgi:hypothetical protein
LVGVNQYYVPLASPVRPAGRVELVYQPRILGYADVHFVDKKRNLEHRRSVRCLAHPPAPGNPVDWSLAEPGVLPLASSAAPGATWDAVPEVLDTARKASVLEKAFASYLYGNSRLTLRENRDLGLVSTPDETTVAFQQRCRIAAGEQAKRAFDQKKLEYEPRFHALGVELVDESQPASSGTWIDWMMGRSSGSNPEAALTERQRVKLRALKADWVAKRREIDEHWRRIGETSTELHLTPRKTDVQVTHFGLAWRPYWRIVSANGSVEMVAASR